MCCVSGKNRILPSICRRLCVIELTIQLAKAPVSVCPKWRRGPKYKSQEWNLALRGWRSASFSLFSLISFITCVFFTYQIIHFLAFLVTTIVILTFSKKKKKSYHNSCLIVYISITNIIFFSYSKFYRKFRKVCFSGFYLLLY